MINFKVLKKRSLLEFSKSKGFRRSAASPKITITSALPYVNGVKHLGNLIGSLLPSDVFHRFLDLRGVENIYICGTDEHGTPTEVAALEEGLSPQQYSDKYYKLQKAIYEKWNFDFSFFGRTSSQVHHVITKDVFLAIRKNGYIKEQSLTLPFCRNDERFLPDRFITGVCPRCSYDSARGDQCEKCSTLLDPTDLIKPRCTVCGRTDIEFREEKHLFLDLSKLQPQLKKWILSNGHWPDNVRNFALGWLKEGLKPRCITRNLKWGISVPMKGYEHLVFYVWFDAPIGYVSITKEGQGRRRIKNWRQWWSEPAKVYHFIGKDNIPFHTVFWPAILLASKKFTLPHYVAGYEYLNWEGQKFSTSRGIGLFSDEALGLFPVDYWRFYLSLLLPESKDSNFDWDDFRDRINSELIGNYGNLLHRATHFVEKNYGGRLPKPGKPGKKEKEVIKKIGDTVKAVEKDVDNVKLREALKKTLALAASVNKYFQEKEPWTFKNKPDTATTVYTAINALRTISLLLSPYIPESSKKALECLGTKTTAWKDNTKFAVKAGTKIRALILFRKIEDKELEAAKKYRTKYSKISREPRFSAEKRSFSEISKNSVLCRSSSSTSSPIKNIIKEENGNIKETEDGYVKLEDFKKLDLRIATIVDVKDHPDADKLFLLRIDLGSEQRQLVAGLKGIYKKEELLGRQAVIIANLEPAVLRGERSEGMLLAADDGTLISPAKKLPNGMKIR